MAVETYRRKQPANASYEDSLSLKNTPNHEFDDMTIFFYTDGVMRIQFPKRVAIHRFYTGAGKDKSQLAVHVYPEP